MSRIWFSALFLCFLIAPIVRWFHMRGASIAVSSQDTSLQVSSEKPAVEHKRTAVDFQFDVPKNKDNLDKFEPNVFMPAQAAAARVAKLLRIFIYDLGSPFNASKKEYHRFARDNVIVHGRYEFEIIDLLKNSRNRVYDPKSADFFFVPIPLGLVMHNIHERLKEKPYYHKDAMCKRCLNYERDLIAEFHRVGPYWNKSSSRHIFVTWRCPMTFDRVRSNNVREFLSFPKLLYGNSLSVCLVGFDNVSTMQNVEWQRVLHTGYYVPPNFYADLRSIDPRSRNILAMYAGADPVRKHTKQLKFIPARRAVWWGLGNCSTCIALPTPGRNRRQPGTASNFFVSLLRTLKRSRFQIIPPGDGTCHGRANREQSITMGVVPVIWAFCEDSKTWAKLPWGDVLNWSAFSVNFTYVRRPDENLWPALEKQLKDLEASGEADRLLAGVAAVQERFFWKQTGVVQTLMESLAMRMRL